MLNLLQAAPQGPGGGLVQFLPMVFIFVIFYFLLIAPMRKRQKRQQEMLIQLKKGDEVITTGGIFGASRPSTRHRSRQSCRSRQREGQVLRSALPAPPPTRIGGADDGDLASELSFSGFSRTVPGGH